MIGPGKGRGKKSGPARSPPGRARRRGIQVNPFTARGKEIKESLRTSYGAPQTVGTLQKRNHQIRSRKEVKKGSYHRMGLLGWRRWLAKPTVVDFLTKTKTKRRKAELAGKDDSQTRVHENMTLFSTPYGGMAGGDNKEGD